MPALLFELRDALRTFRRHAGHSATVVATLALTTGAATAVFSIVDGVLLRPLAYPASDRLVQIEEIWRQYEDRYPRLPANVQHFELWRAHASSFESLAQYIVLPHTLTGTGDATQIAVARTSGSLFDVLRVQPALGRALSAADERPGSDDVLVVSDRLWRERLGGDPDAVGRSLTLDGKPHVIVGVAPAGFRLPGEARLRDDVDGYVAIRPAAESQRWAGEHNMLAVGRLRPGVSPAEARAELDILQAHAGERASADAQEPVTLASAVTPLAERIVGGARRGLLLLLAAIGAVLLIACSNLASLATTRAVNRARDTAIRSALGASRLRLAGAAVLEQLLLAAVGGALGLWVAWGALAVFVRTAPISLPRASEVALDLRVFAFAAAVSLLAGLVVALIPAWQIARATLQDRLRAGAMRITADRRSLRSRRMLLALQIALSIMLLVVTGLLGTSFLRLSSADLGFDAARVVAIPMALPVHRYTEAPQRVAAFDRTLAAVQTLPGVRSAATVSLLPLAGQGQVNFVVPEGQPAQGGQLTANFRMVGPDYFRTIGLPLVRGRAFGAGERAPDRPTPALLSEAAAAALWPGEDALGRHFSRGSPDEAAFVVIGIVGNARTTNIDRDAPAMVYVPYWWQSRTFASLLVRTDADPSSAAAAVRQAVRRVDPEMALGQAQTMEDIVDDAVAGRRYHVQLLVAFGAIALLIATLGVYAVTAQDVGARRREMNIRVALGAEPRQVLILACRQAAVPVVAGAAAGVGGALAAAGSVASLLVDVAPRDPAVIGGITAVVTAVGLLACVVAARQALAIEPVSALKDE